MLQGEHGTFDALELCAPKEFKPVATPTGVDANHVQHAMRCKKRGHLDEALLAYNRADSKRPNSLVTVFNRAVVLHMMKLYQQAVDEYSLAIILAPENAYGYFNRAVSLYARDDCDAAVSDLDKAVELLPERYEFYVNRALCYRCRQLCSLLLQL